MDYNKENLPKHIAIILDGNRRWAKAKGMPAAFGHKEGAKNVERIARHCNKLGVEYLTVYAFSTENWKRTEEEVNSLMMLFQSYIDHYSKIADSENIKVIQIPCFQYEGQFSSTGLNSIGKKVKIFDENNSELYFNTVDQLFNVKMDIDLFDD